MAGRLISKQFVDNTGYSDREWIELVPQFDQEFSLVNHDAQSPPISRTDLRYLSPTALPIYALFRMPDQNWLPRIVRCRNLSERGIGLYLGEALEPGSRCYILFKERDKSDKILGVVRHCTPLRDNIHFAGVVFDQPIDLKIYLPLLKNDVSWNRVSDSVAGMVHAEPDRVTVRAD